MKTDSSLYRKAAVCQQARPRYGLVPLFIVIVAITAIAGGFGMWRIYGVTETIGNMLKASSGQVRIGAMLKASARDCLVHTVYQALIDDDLVDMETSMADYELNRESFCNYMRVLRNGNNKIGIPPVEPGSRIEKKLREVDSRWADFEQSASIIIERQRRICEKVSSYLMDEAALADARSSVRVLIGSQLHLKHSSLQTTLDDLLVLFSQRIVETNSKVKSLQQSVNVAIGAVIAAVVLIVVFLSRYSYLKEAMAVMKEAKDAAQAASEAKSHFLANVSHEVRTPINGIAGMTEQMLDTRLTAEQIECVETIRECTRKFLYLINNILDFSKTQTGELEIETTNFDLHRTFRDIGDAIEIEANNKGLEFDCSFHPAVPERVCGDPGRVRQILMSLADNAIKFTDTGHILIRCSVETESANEISIRFEISDTGVGICDSELVRIYKGFSQVDGSMTRKRGGLGLGLAVSKKLVERLGGQLGVESEAGEGSTFWFTVLFKKHIKPLPESQNKRRADIASTRIEGSRILIVDEGERSRRNLREPLEYWRCCVDEAATGSEAMDKLMQAMASNNAFDVVIVDSNIVGPECSMFDVAALCNMAKDNPGACNTRMIMMASSGLRGDGARAKTLGFSAYLPKPIRQFLLHDCLVKLMSKPDKALGEDSANFVTKHSLLDAREHMCRILVVEDNAVNQKVVLRILKKNGYEADTASNGREALLALESVHYDLVLMDVQMPEMDGVEATKAIRNGQSPAIDSHIPIVALTAHALEGDRARFIAAGMDDYVIKPINPSQLIMIVDRFSNYAMSGPSFLP